ncbi:NAD(P)/FAD-dependent oxidoreductase, partial [Corynebacterium lubricantis]|uniref:NAD(P)/FAD-dependent oxidoreductase n=1 Tax=Corynebacterium lubricantis TaxID=541095 RepID=UPI000369C116
MTKAETTGLLIIGSSQAGVQLAISLRALGYESHITLLGDENHRPYQRPALSKEYLQGKYDKERLIFRSQDYWDDHNISVVKNSRIASIDSNPDGSGIATSTDGTTYQFERVALAVGARARKLDIPGSDAEGIIYLRNADDALKLRASLDSVTDVVVIGGGFIGLEAACSFHGMGMNVTVVERGPRLVGRAVGEETADYFLHAHTNRGLNIKLDTGVNEIREENGRVTGVVLDSGEEIPAQIVLVGIGVIPNTELAADMGLEINNGIVVDRYALASDGTTIAIGDVANIPNPLESLFPDSRVRIERVASNSVVYSYRLVNPPCRPARRPPRYLSTQLLHILERTPTMASAPNHIDPTGYLD